MKFSLLCSTLLLATISTAGTFLGCNSLSTPAPANRQGTLGADSGARYYEELGTPVPANFSDAEKWNGATLCPEGTVLSPFTRYSYSPGEKSYGFKSYYGRSCQFVIERGDGASARNPAAVTGSSPASISLIPHGPYIWWYENGKRMGSGSFDHGTLATDWTRWEPDGSLAAR